MKRGFEEWDEDGIFLPKTLWMARAGFRVQRGPTLASGSCSQSETAQRCPELGCLGVLPPPPVLMCTQRQILLFIYFFLMQGQVWLPAEGRGPQTPRGGSSDAPAVALGAVCAWCSSREQGQLQLWAGSGGLRPCPAKLSSPGLGGTGGTRAGTDLGGRRCERRGGGDRNSPWEGVSTPGKGRG